MKKNILIAIWLLIIGLITFILGINSSEMLLEIIGAILIILSTFFIYVELTKEKEETVIIFPEEGYKPILSTKRKAKKKIRILFFMSLLVGTIIVIILGNLINTYGFSHPYLSLQDAVNRGCVELSKRGCKDPSSIIVLYDVNNDGIIGGKEDTLTNLLAKYNCTGDCVLLRCGCPINV